MVEVLSSHRLTLPNELLIEQTQSNPFAFAMASRDADVLNLVRGALVAGRAQLAFQPVVVAAKPDQNAFYEALIRVMDENGRIIPAAHFMPVIEETDLGRRIDAMSLELALRMLRNNPGAKLSVNVSARSLGDSTWRRVLEGGLQERGNLGDRLIFEISETSAMLLHEIVIRFIKEIQPRGVGFALDGFGSGMTSFRYLKDFFFDLVKIDKGFVKGIANDPDNQVLAEALITVAHQFEMFVVADGVEAKEDAAFLTQLGADCLQGYHFGVPQMKLM